MHSPDSLRNRFADGDLTTASGNRVVVMCFDRLDRDFATALAAIAEQDHYTTNRALGHAQDLITELAGMLDLGAWEHATTLLSVYDYLLRRLAQSNAAKDANGVNEVRRLTAELGAGFREAAAAAATAGGPAAPERADAAGPSPDAGDHHDRPRLSVHA